MFKTLYNGMTGMTSQMQKLDVTGNNIANVGTVGYKRQSVSFTELLRQQVSSQGIPVLPGGATETSQGSGVKVASTTRRHSQGNLNHTGRGLDLAVHGDGFFQVTRDDGRVFYTRDGSFNLDAQGLIKNSQGYALLDQQLPEGYKKLVINEAGMVTCEDKDGNVQEIGQIELAIFSQPEGLEAIGDNLYVPTELSGEPELTIPGEDNSIRIMQGYLEGSNVDLVAEMQSLIEGQRSFQLNSKSISTADHLWNITNNLQK